jgi:aspartyl-tRNA(Asn)/glutamyl-tRNA(Gln) amidotransferase subunit C
MTATPEPAIERARRAAALARIAIDAHELPGVAAELEAALEAARSLREVSVVGIEPLWTLAECVETERSDRVEPSLPRELVLANAPEQREGLLQVPDAAGGRR